MIVEQKTTADLSELVGSIDDAKTNKKIESFIQDITSLQALSKSSTAQLMIKHIRSEIGLDSSLSALDKSREGKNKNGHLDDLRALEELSSIHPQPSSFLGWLNDAVRGSERTNPE